RPREGLLALKVTSSSVVELPEVVYRPPPLPEAVLPLTVTLVSASVPALFLRPPPLSALPPLTVRPDSATELPGTSNTRVLSPPLIVRRFAPGPAIVVFATSVSTSGLDISVIVFCVAKTDGSKVIESPVVCALTVWTGGRRVTCPNREPPPSAGLLPPPDVPWVWRAPASIDAPRSPPR